MLEEKASFRLPANVRRLARQVWAIRKWRAEEIDAIARAFGDPGPVITRYTAPDCCDAEGVRQGPLLARLRPFLNGGAPGPDGGNQLLLLGDPGSGKTAFLVLLKMASISLFWPRGHYCALIKLGPDLTRQLERLRHSHKTILLLDGYDEDSETWRRPSERLIEILRETRFFRRVIIATRPSLVPPVAAHAGNLVVPIDSNPLPALQLAPFTNAQLRRCLNKTFRPRLLDRLLFRSHARANLAMNCLRHTSSLAARPLLATHATFLTDPPPTASAAAACGALATGWLRAEARAMADRRPGEPPSPEQLGDGCAALAALLFEERQDGVDETELINHGIRWPELRLIPEISVNGSSLLQRNADGHFRFAHFLIQQHFAAMRADQRPQIARILKTLAP